LTELVENYPGIESGSGIDIVSAFKKQVAALELECREGTVKSIRCGEEGGFPIWRVEDDKGEYKTLSVIIASGASPKKLEVPGEEEFLGRGVSYCATCDGAFFRDKDIIVVGGGDSAVEEALFLTRFGRKVTIVHRRDRLRAVKLLQERAFANEKLDFVWDSVVEEVKGADKVEKIALKNVKTDEKTEISCDGVFIFAGWQPNTGFLGDLVEMENGRIIVDNEMKTSQEGIFACGDCCKKILYQIVTACGDGATASFSARQYVEELEGIAYK
jgi:thioredoxin reductase (NADPH)